jgi:hypothetical protein
VRPTRSVRIYARLYLHGGADAPELQGPLHVLADSDQAANCLFKAEHAAGVLHDRLTNPMSDSFLMEGVEVVQRLDDVEVRAHSAFMQRVRELAGEN